MRALTTGQLARQAGLGVETVRYYERKGLVAEPERRKSGYRQYPKESVARLVFIRRARLLGFSLAEVQELLDLQDSKKGTCGDVQRRIQSKLAEVDQRIQDLEEIRRTLVRLAAACVAEAPTTECPAIKELAHTAPEAVNHPHAR